jgi:glycosyltransferase involved in cell wall biosynthesis
VAEVRRRILVLTPSLPYPPIWGFGTRVYQFLRLLGRTHSVSLLTYAEPGEGDKVAALAEVCAAVHTVPRRTETERGKRLAQLSSVFSRLSYQRRNRHSPAMQEKLNDLTSRERFDIIQIESSQMAGFEFDRQAARVLDEHNIEYELLYRMYRTEQSVTRRFYNWLEFTKFRREETSTWQNVSGCVSTSVREESMIQQAAPHTPTVVVPNAVDADYFRPWDEPANDRALAMTGLMHYRPNIDGALFFLEDVFPHILASRPKTVFYIVGAGAPDELKRLAGPNVVVTDTVPDVRPYVGKSAVLVVPLRMGGGTRLKVVEALSMEKPVVSTSLGCEGIDVKHLEHLLIADEARDFADAVLKLLADRELALKLGRQGRALVMRQYTWETVVNRLEGFYERLLAPAPAGVR